MSSTSDSSQTAVMTIEELLKSTPEDLDARSVDCDRCPISITCMMGIKSNYPKFGCCGAIGVTTEVSEGIHLLVVDCAKHNMGDGKPSQVKCSLCSGDIASVYARRWVDHYAYLRTVNSKVTAKARVKAIAQGKKSKDV